MKRLRIWMVFFLLLVPLTGLGQYAVDWVQAANGQGTDLGTEVLIDQQNNVYLSGSFTEDLSVGDQVLSSISGRDAFLAKFSAEGIFQWVQKIASSSSFDVIGGSEVDGEGNVYLTGSFEGNLQIGDTIISAVGQSDLYIITFSPNGNLRWIRTVGSANFDFGTSIKSSADGTILIAGNYGEGIDFEGVVLPESGGQLFVANYTTSGEFLWVKSYHEETSGNNFRPSIDIDYQGNIYIESTYDTPGGDINGLVVKTDNEGTPIWSKIVTATNESLRFNDIRVSPDDKIFVYGTSGGFTIFPGLPGFNTGISSPLVAKFDADGTTLWARYYGGDDIGFLRAATMNAKGISYLLADFTAAILDTFDLSLSDEAVFELDSAGNVMAAMGFAKQSERTEALDLSLDHFDNLLITGSYRRDFELGDTTLIPTADTEDIFLVKHANCNFELRDFLDEDSISICPGNLAQIQAYDGSACGFTYQWDHGPTTASIEVQPDSSQFYFLTISDSSGQQRRDSIYVALLDFTPPELVAEQVLCQGETLTLDAGAGYQTYEWSTGANTASIEVTQADDYWVTVTSATGCQATDTVNVNVEVCTALPEFKSGSMKIYPNPNGGQFNLVLSEPLEEIQLQIVDLTGRTHFEQVWKRLPAGDYVVNADLPEGMYVLIIQTKKSSYRMKLLVD